MTESLADQAQRNLARARAANESADRELAKAVAISRRTTATDTTATTTYEPRYSRRTYYSRGISGYYRYSSGFSGYYSGYGTDTGGRRYGGRTSPIPRDPGAANGSSNSVRPTPTPPGKAIE